MCEILTASKNTCLQVPSLSLSIDWIPTDSGHMKDSSWSISSSIPLRQSVGRVTEDRAWMKCLIFLQDVEKFIENSSHA